MLTLGSTIPCIHGLQEKFRMWEPKSFETKLSVYKRELTDDSSASLSAGYVKTLRGRNSPVEALFAKK